MSILQASILGAIALILLPGYSFYFDLTPKTVVLLAGTAFALALYLRTPRLDARADGSRVLTAFGVLAGFAFLSVALSAALSDRPSLSIFGSSWRQFGAVSQAAVLLFAWLAARNTAGHPDRVRVILRGLLIASSAAALYGVGQYFGWDPLLAREAYHIGEGTWTIVRPPGTFGYVSYFATWLTVTSYLCFLLAAKEDLRGWKWAARAGGALCAGAAVLTGTRAAMLGLAAGGLVLAGLRARKPSRTVCLLAFLVLLAGLGFYSSPVGWNLRSRTRWFVEDPFGGARLMLWRDSLRMAWERPLFGYGPETFPSAFPRFESVRLASAYPDFAHESPHNIVLDTLIAQGLGGVLLAAGFVLIGVAAIRRLRRQDPEAAALLAAALGAGFMCQQFTAFTAPTALLLFTVLGLAVGMCSGPPRPLSAIVAPLCAVAAALLLIAAVRLAMADHSLARARQAIETRGWQRAATAFDRYRRLRLPGGSAELWYSRAIIAGLKDEPDPVTRVRAVQNGLEAAGRATESADEPFNAWYNAALYSAARNDAPATERCLRKAIAARPNWFKPHWTLAQLLSMSGRSQEATEEAELAVRLSAGKLPEVNQTLSRIREVAASVAEVNSR